jgi:hypothetical protein
MKDWPIGNEYPLLGEKRKTLDDYLGRAKNDRYGDKGGRHGS